MNTVTQPAAPRPSTLPPPSARRRRDPDELAEAYQAAIAPRGPLSSPETPLAAELLRGLGVERFETDGGSAGLAILAEGLETLRVLVAAMTVGEMDDEASASWDGAVAALQDRMHAGYNLAHREMHHRREPLTEAPPTVAAPKPGAPAPRAASWPTEILAACSKRLAADAKDIRENVAALYNTIERLRGHVEPLGDLDPRDARALGALLEEVPSLFLDTINVCNALSTQPNVGEPLPSEETEDESDEPAPAPSTGSYVEMTSAMRDAAERLERARAHADAMFAAAGDDNVTTDLARHERAYLDLLAEVREVRTTCLFFGGGK